MAWFLLFGLYLLKHAVMAHVVDAGYSQSRQPGTKFYPSLALYVGCEIIATALMLNAYRSNVVGPMLVLEAMGLLLVAFYERRATINQLLRQHLLAEISMVGLYWFLAFQIN